MPPLVSATVIYFNIILTEGQENIRGNKWVRFGGQQIAGSG
ncbi:hypothetical protein PRVXT_000605 [Proteinivorax tanatarense]|uniref:Uncharacterized protein n=1 Tax=Proteinivorax tanatarense TaxID=1260629 RepID=A0AAU7VN26_9FIRM